MNAKRNMSRRSNVIAKDVKKGVTFFDNRKRTGEDIVAGEDFGGSPMKCAELRACTTICTHLKDFRRY